MVNVRAVCPVDEVNIRLVACGVSTTNLKKKKSAEAKCDGANQ
nr:MAG TPA: hypothetical protein [Bacteriophage sp.]